MSLVNLHLDNSLNSPENNPPGFNQWVGGTDRGDPAGIKVDKLDTDLIYTIPLGTPFLQTWYYDGFEWNSGANINGPFTDGEKITLVKSI